MQDLITLYTPELLKAFAVLTALLFGANILQAIAAINRRNELAEAHDGKQAAMEMLKQATDKAKKVQAERDMANELRDRCEKTMRAAMEENDRLMIERANLYFRNAKGQIEPITPKPIKPHTLKHGMTVKDPTPYQAKRIFAAARRAGIDANEEKDIFHRKSRFIAYTAGDRLNPKNIIYHSTFATHRNTYISAREFLRRIKGEIE